MSCAVTRIGTFVFIFCISFRRSMSISSMRIARRLCTVLSARIGRSWWSHSLNLVPLRTSQVCHGSAHSTTHIDARTRPLTHCAGYKGNSRELAYVCGHVDVVHSIDAAVKRKRKRCGESKSKRAEVTSAYGVEEVLKLEQRGSGWKEIQGTDMCGGECVWMYGYVCMSVYVCVLER